MTLDNLLAEERFDAARYYLKENGFLVVSDLVSFDFDELYFVPGIDETLIDEIKERYEGETSGGAIEENEVNQDDLVDTQMQIAEEPKANDAETIDEAVQSIFAESYARLASVLKTDRNWESCRSRLIEHQQDFTQDQYEFLLFFCDQMVNNTDTYSEEQETLLKATSIEVLFADVRADSGRRCGVKFTKYCHENAWHSLWDLKDFSFDAANVKGMSAGAMHACRMHYYKCVQEVLNPKSVDQVAVVSPKVLFVEKWNELSEKQKICTVKVTRGATLQSVGDELGITRERVRQICNKTNRILRISSIRVAESILVDGMASFSIEDIESLFDDENLSYGCISALKECEEFTYIPFAEKFYKGLPNNWKQGLKMIEEDLVGEGMDFYANLEIIEDELARIGLSCFDFYDFLSYLLRNRYRIYGDFVVQGRQAYSAICLDVIKKYFSAGIKLDNDENNPDMLKLREVVKEEYGNYELPPNNRAITARVTPRLILCDRGKYCLPDYIDCTTELLNDIVVFINNSTEQSLYYYDLFNEFSGCLLMESNIDNYHFLHGVLRYMYPDEFQYERDAVIKQGGQKIPLEIRISELICQAGGPVTKTDIQRDIPYAYDARLFNAVSREPGLIQWGHNVFNHIDNVKCSEEDKEQLRQIITRITGAKQGYCNERELMATVQRECPEFMQKNGIQEVLSLYNVVACIFASEFRFSRPHIASTSFPDIELTNINVARYFLGDVDAFTYSHLVKLAKQYWWSDSTITSVLVPLEREYVRLNEEEYVKKSLINISEETVSSMDAVVASNMGTGSYVALFAAFNFDNYPDIGYRWNEFVLHSIIEGYSKKYKIIEPRMRDRRYKRGIIIDRDSPCVSFEELVTAQMKADNYTVIPQDQFAEYLIQKGLLLTGNVPQEMYEGDGVRLENGYFIV